jgi:hypothetical protein
MADLERFWRKTPLGPSGVNFWQLALEPLVTPFLPISVNHIGNLLHFYLW